MRIPIGLRRIPTSEEVLLAALRACLRRLGGRIDIDPSDLEQRSAEGPIVTGEYNGRLYVEMLGVLTDDECIAILMGVDEGTDPVVACDDGAAIYAGNVRYRTSAGHEIVVFNDCDSWDYVDAITHADGRHWDYFDGCLGQDPVLSTCNWAPSNSAAWCMGWSGWSEKLCAKMPRIVDPG